MSETFGIARRACGSCPYLRSTPSGVWHPDEYEKLRDYDLPTGEQPMGTFMCHQLDGSLCAGWVAVHGDELLGLRIAQATGRVTSIPKIEGEFYSSGNEAADAGLAGCARPSREAVRVAAKIVTRRNGKRRPTSPRRARASQR